MVTKRDNSINMKEIRARYYEFSGGSNVGIPGRASPSNSPRGCGYRTPEEIHRQPIHSHLCGRVCLADSISVLSPRLIPSPSLYVDETGLLEVSG